MKNFEKYAAQQLHDYASPVDTERLWQDIERELRPQKRRAFAWRWAFSLLGAAALAGSAFLYFEKGERAKPTVEVLEKQPIAKIENPGAQHEARNSKLENRQSKLEIDNQNLENRQSKIEIGDQKVEIGDSKSEIGNQNLAIGNSKSEIGNQNLEIGNQKLETGNSKSPISDFKFQISNLPATLPLRRPATLEFEKSIVAPGRIAPAAEQHPEVGCYSFRSRFRLSPYVGVYGGAQFPVKKLDTADPEYSPIAAGRRETETTLEAVSTGGYLGLELLRGISVEAGAELHRLNERFDWSRTSIDTIGHVAIVGVIVNAPGDTTFFSDTVSIVQEVRTEKKIFNRYTFVNVPIALSYAWNNGGRLTPYIKAGVALNMAFRQKAEILNLAGDPMRYDSDSSAVAGYPFRSKIGISPFATLGARFALTNRLEVFAEARYLHHSRNLTARNYPVRQRYGFPGLNLGLQVRI